MMDCRKALVESDGDFEKAIDYLRKKGQKVAALRSDREDLASGQRLALEVAGRSRLVPHLLGRPVERPPPGSSR